MEKMQLEKIHDKAKKIPNSCFHNDISKLQNLNILYCGFYMTLPVYTFDSDPKYFWFDCFIWATSCQNLLFAIREQQRYRSACTSEQSDQRLCCSLPGLFSISTCYSRNFKTLASLCSWAGRFESYIVANPENRFSRDVTHLFLFAFLLFLPSPVLPSFRIRFRHRSVKIH